MERETGIEPATSSLGSWRSTAELLPLSRKTKLSLPLRADSLNLHLIARATEPKTSGDHCEAWGVVVIKPTHCGLYYEDCVLKRVLNAGRYVIPRNPRNVNLGFYRRQIVKIVLVEVRERKLTIKEQEILTADKIAIRVETCNFLSPIPASIRSPSEGREAEVNTLQLIQRYCGSRN